jgi:hypothetical protein
MKEKNKGNKAQKQSTRKAKTRAKTPEQALTQHSPHAAKTPQQHTTKPEPKTSNSRCKPNRNTTTRLIQDETNIRLNTPSIQTQIEK